MIGEVRHWLARAQFVQRSLDVLLAAPENTLVILPSTRGALQLARRLCDFRTCQVTAGPITVRPSCRLSAHVRAPQDIVLACADFAEMQCMVISFPDQLVGHEASFRPVPFLGTNHWFSTTEATLVMRHRPRVYAASGFKLTQVEYDDLLDGYGRARSWRDLMSRLFACLEQELAHPPRDWLAARYLAQKSEAGVRSRLREELKEIECLLRLHARSVGCDRVGTATAIAAITAHGRFLS